MRRLFRFLTSMIGAFQIPIRFLISVLKQPLLLQGGYGALEVLNSFLSDSYQIPIRSLSYPNEAPIQIPNFNVDAHQIPIRSPSDSYQLPVQIPQCNLIHFGANQLPIRLPSDSYQQNFWSINPISYLTQHTSRTSQPIEIFVLKRPLYCRGVMCTGSFRFPPIRLLSYSHQNPIRFQCGPIHIPKFNDRCLSDSHQIPYQTPISFPSESSM